MSKISIDLILETLTTVAGNKNYPTSDRLNLILKLIAMFESTGVQEAPTPKEEK